jgi:hypothetical protein
MSGPDNWSGCCSEEKQFSLNSDIQCMNSDAHLILVIFVHHLLVPDLRSRFVDE